jgi:methyl-accepting chemotaxis protein
MGEITSASSEQSIGIDQVNTAITQMDQVTQQNAALVEEAAAAAASMQEQAARLSEVASSFKLGNEVAMRPMLTAPPKPRASLPPARAARPAPTRSPAPAPRLASRPAPAKLKATVGGDKDWEEF